MNQPHRILLILKSDGVFGNHNQPDQFATMRKANYGNINVLHPVLHPAGSREKEKELRR